MKLFLFDSTAESDGGEKFIFESDGKIHHRLFPYYMGKIVKRLYAPKFVVSYKEWITCSVKHSTILSDPNDIMKDLL